MSFSLCSNHGWPNTSFQQLYSHFDSSVGDAILQQIYTTVSQADWQSVLILLWNLLGQADKISTFWWSWIKSWLEISTDICCIMAIHLKHWSDSHTDSHTGRLWLYKTTEALKDAVQTYFLQLYCPWLFAEQVAWALQFGFKRGYSAGLCIGLPKVIASWPIMKGKV